MKFSFWLWAVLVYNVSGAQNAETYTVKAGEKIGDVISSKVIFQYPDFIPGTVVFKDGVSTGGRLNYNTLIAAVQFIDPKGDTLSLANEETIKYILVSKDTFYYNEGYLRLLTGNASVKLAEKVFFQEFIQKPGSYGMSTATTATNNLSSIIDKRSIELNTSQEIVLVKGTSFFIGNKFNEFRLADKKSVLKMFPRQKKAIENYLKDNEVNFRKEEDLVKFTEFLKELSL